MEQHLSSSKVTVEYFDPHDVYKLLAPGLIPRLPLRYLHWQSHAGPLRSIDTLHIQLVASGTPPPDQAPSLARSTSATHHLSRDDGFHVQPMGAAGGAGGDISPGGETHVEGGGRGRRHQIPGLRPTPYLKVLLVRCDSSESYKTKTRAEIREWLKKNTPPSASRKASTQENHDAFEWLIVHVVIPNTAAAGQPRTTKESSESATTDKTAASRLFGGGSSTLLEKMRSDFNSSGKHAVERVAQVRIGINDVPYDLLPRVVPAVPTGYVETAQDVQAAWEDLIAKVKDLILLSFDSRVTQYEEDIREKDAQRALPGWNFCTFFILKEGLARGFESVGLVEDALVGYDQLAVGLDAVLQDQEASGSPQSHGSELLTFTDELKDKAVKAVSALAAETAVDQETVDLQDGAIAESGVEDIIISSTRKPYRELILANNVSLFDFRCYIFSRQIALLLRLANAWSSREELLSKLREQQESITRGVAPRAVPKRQAEESENLAMLAEICRRTLQFIPAISHVMRNDIIAAMRRTEKSEHQLPLRPPQLADVVDNIVSSFAFSVAQQILAQTSTKALRVPPSALLPPDDGHEPKESAAVAEPKTIAHPVRSSSYIIQAIRSPAMAPPSPGFFPGPGRSAGFPDSESTARVNRAGLEDLAARRAELFMLSRNVLEEAGKKRGWSDGWRDAPVVGGGEDVAEMEEVNLDDTVETGERQEFMASPLGIDSRLLRAALEDKEDFYKLYEILTDKSLRHYTVAGHAYSVQTCMTDLGVLKYHVADYASSAAFFYRAILFFGEAGWALLELSMLVMYAKCLSKLRRQDEYVKVVQKVLAKAALAERERLAVRAGISAGPGRRTHEPDFSVVKGFLAELLEATRELDTPARLPLEDLFTNVDVDGVPEYDEGRDSFSLKIKLHSLLLDGLEIEATTLHMTCVDAGPSKELELETKAPVVLRPGRNKIRLWSNSISPGRYRADRLSLVTPGLSLHFERDPSQPAEDMFRRPDVRVFQRAGGLDVKLMAGKDMQLGTNKPLDLEIHSGWNAIAWCKIRVKAATGGLRLLTTETKFLDDAYEFSSPPEAGLLSVGAIAPQTSVTLRFPYSLEQDLAKISVRLEVTFGVGDDIFKHSTIAVVPVSLPLKVNVQDVFRHSALLSRFNVMTASTSPMRLYKASLEPSELFQSEFGVPPSDTMLVFPREPASLLYRISRKPNVKLRPDTRAAATTMHLKLWYSIVQAEVDDLLRGTITEALGGEGLGIFVNVVGDEVVAEFNSRVSGPDLERAALLGWVSTAFMASTSWEARFLNLGFVPGTTDPVASRIRAFLQAFQATHPTIRLVESASPCCVTIPVAIPSIAVLHTVDMTLNAPPPSIEGSSPVLTVNSMYPATASLRWSRMWDTESLSGFEDKEFSYEVHTAGDAWLIGGRRRGHFVIAGTDDMTSQESTEGAVEVALMPLREGWMPWPSVEIKEVVPEGKTGKGRGGGGGGEAGGAADCEVDLRNVGEVVKIVGERRVVTVSLDASGPGGGPLVLDVEGSVKTIAVGLGGWQGR